MRRHKLVVLVVLVGVGLFLTALAGTAFSAGEPGRTVTLTDGDDVYHANQEQLGAQTIYGLKGDDRIWSGIGHDVVYGGPGDDRLHNFQAASGAIYGGPGRDVCVVGVKSGGHVNAQVRGCEVIKFRPSQGRG
jgi:Ca2+-binding RTX toxin-like protein